MKDSKHSYERLNWTVALQRPIIKYESHLFTIGDEDMKPCDVMEVIKDSTIIVKGVAELGRLRLSEDTEKHYLKMYHNEMLKWFEKYNTFENKILFTTLTVPPNETLKVHKKNQQYGCVKHPEQIRYLRTKIYDFFKCCDINKYIIVYEVTRNLIIHAHIVYVQNEEITEGYKDLAHIMGYNTFKKIQINIVEKYVNDVGVINYLCKLESAS